MIDAPTRPLVVAEVFGPTFQGEGPSMGQRAAFVRLGGCNLACSWCDTPYTWDWKRYDPKTELRKMSVDDTFFVIAAMRVGLVVITGGEPLLQSEALAPLLERLYTNGYRVEIETNGTIAPTFPDYWARFNVSPKLTSAGNDPGCIDDTVLRLFRAAGRSVFKFVCADVAALAEVDEIVKRLDLIPATVWVMPEGTTVDAILARTRALAPSTLDRGYNLSTRLHTLLWGSERGR